MLAQDLAEQIPTVTPRTTGAEAARLMAEYRLSGVVVADDRGRPVAVIPGSQLLGLILPSFLSDNPNLAHSYDEESADELCQRLNSVTLDSLLQGKALTAHKLPSVLPDDTLVEIASVMVQGHFPLICVTDQAGKYLGVITLSRFMAAIAAAAGQDSTLVQHRLNSDIIERPFDVLGGDANGAAR